MNWKVLKTEDDYNKASIRMMEIFNSEPNNPESDELDLLIVLVKDYDEKNYQLPELDALEVIKYKMQEMGMKYKDEEAISKGKDLQMIGEKYMVENAKAKEKDDFMKEAH